MPSHFISWRGTGSNILTDDSVSDTFDDEVPLEDLMNATNILISTSKKTLAGSSGPLTGEQNESFLSNENADNENYLGNEHVGNEASCSTSVVKNNQGSFYFKKNSNKKCSRSDMLFDRLNYSINSFMKAWSQADNEFLSNLLEKEEQNKNEEVVIWVCAKGDHFCIEVKLDMKMCHTRFIDLISSEFSLLDSQ